VALRRRTEREERGLFLAEGIRVVEALADSALDVELVVVSDSLAATPRGAALLAGLGSKHEVRAVPDSVLARVAATESPQGVVVAARIPAASLETVPVRERSTVLVLDAVQDPGNFGTLVRSADAFGADLVLALPGTVDPWNPKAVRAAAGSSFHVPILSAGTEEALAWLRSHAYRILAADTEGVPVGSVPGAERNALVVGNEGAGIGQAVRAAADAVVAVPIRVSAESLNVGVAAGILLYLLTREH
jgi:TrmH family RNA methyltransferase